MVDILDAARYLIFLSYGRKKYSLTPLKLQKLLYLTQGWSYVWDNKPAFVDDFCAWQYGPVNERVYSQSPWKNAYSMGLRITNSSIQTYFQSTF